MTQEELNKQLINAARNGRTDQVIKLLDAGADINAYDPESGTPLHRMLRSFAWNCDSRFFRRRDPREDVETIAWMLRLGAKWIPPKSGSEPDCLCRCFYRGEPKIVVEVIRLLDAADACETSLLRELINKPKRRGWVGLQEPELLDRVLAQ